MPPVTTFTYEAVDSTGAIRKGNIDSESADAAAVALSGQKLVPLMVTASGAGLRRELKLPGLRSRRAGVRELAIFSLSIIHI